IALDCLYWIGRRSSRRNRGGLNHASADSFPVIPSAIAGIVASVEATASRLRRRCRLGGCPHASFWVFARIGIDLAAHRDHLHLQLRTALQAVGSTHRSGNGVTYDDGAVTGHQYGVTTPEGFCERSAKFRSGDYSGTPVIEFPDVVDRRCASAARQRYRAD